MVVISGIAGRFPECDNMDELRAKLLAKEDLVTMDDRRWPVGAGNGAPERFGKLKSVTKFDNKYFEITDNIANLMDAQTRMFLELTFEALCDSGTNPNEVRGKKVAVFVGMDISETQTCFQKQRITSKVESLSAYRTMYANRISYYFDLKGPSFTLSTACSSTAMALTQAVAGIRSAQFDSAIVAASNLCLSPIWAQSINNQGILSHDGRSKFLDKNANGYARAETAAVIYVQKLSEAKRVYAKIVNIMANSDGFKPIPTRPSPTDQSQLMMDCMAQVNVTPDQISFVEAHGTGTAVGDEMETLAVYKAYCMTRDKPLVIGSVKTNLGHAEAASTMCQLAKVIIMFEHRIVPANLHFTDPHKPVRDIIAHHLDVVTENRQFEGGIVSVNAFGMGGSNVNLLLEANDCGDREPTDKLQLPFIVPLFARTESGITRLYKRLTTNPNQLTSDFISLWTNLANVPQMAYRGYLVQCYNTDIQTIQNHKSYSCASKRPNLYYVFLGLNSFDSTKINTLMKYRGFRKSMKLLNDILKLEFDADLMKCLNSDKPTMTDVLIVCIATQLALVDLLRDLGVIPNNSFGYSLGILTCLYIDGVLDHRDVVSISMHFVKKLNSKLMVGESRIQSKQLDSILSEQMSAYFMKNYSEEIFDTFQAKSIFNGVDQKLTNHTNSGSSVKQLFTDVANGHNQTSIILEMSMLNHFKDKLDIQNNQKYLSLSGVDDIECSLLSVMGSLYENQYDIDFSRLQDTTRRQFPVRRGTQSISSLIEWDHSKDWWVPSYKDFI